jgi:hypothetical protein
MAASKFLTDNFWAYDLHLRVVYVVGSVRDLPYVRNT